MTQPQSAEKVILEAQKRETFGKQTRSLRKSGTLPSNIYGPGFESVAIGIDSNTFQSIYKSAGETTVVYVKVEDKEYPTLISEIQYHPVTEEILHVDLRKVNLRQKIEASVPLVFVGESEAVEVKNGVLLTQLVEVTVSALPTNIPHQIEVDISALKDNGDMIRIADLAKSGEYEVVDEADRVIVTVAEHKEEAIEPETAAEAPEIITEGKAEAAEGESTDKPETKQE